MHKSLLLAFVFCAALVIPVAALSTPDPPLCRVQVSAQPDRINGFYKVQISLRPDCPENAVADVRLESYVGGRYPRSGSGWFRITDDHPLRRAGIPWYWRVGWRSASGTVYYIPITESP